MSRDQEDAAAAADDATIKSRHINKFYLPGASSNSVESYISINNKRWGDFNTVGAPQHWNRLIRAIGTMPSIAHSSNISNVTYGCAPGTDANSFCIGFDLEKVPQATASGENVTTGGLVSIHLANVRWRGESHASLSGRILFGSFGTQGHWRIRVFLSVTCNGTDYCNDRRYLCDTSA